LVYASKSSATLYLGSSIILTSTIESASSYKVQDIRCDIIDTKSKILNITKIDKQRDLIYPLEILGDQPFLFVI